MLASSWGLGGWLCSLPLSQLLVLLSNPWPTAALVQSLGRGPSCFSLRISVSSYEDRSDRRRAHTDPGWAHLNLIFLARNLFLSNVPCWASGWTGALEEHYSTLMTSLFWNQFLNNLPYYILHWFLVSWFSPSVWQWRNSRGRTASMILLALVPVTLPVPFSFMAFVIVQQSEDWCWGDHQ